MLQFDGGGALNSSQTPFVKHKTDVGAFHCVSVNLANM